MKSPKPVENEPDSQENPETKVEPTKPDESLYAGVVDDAEISTTSKPEETKKVELVEAEPEVNEKQEPPTSPKKEEFLAPLPELSKWERDENVEKLDDSFESIEKGSPEPEDNKSSKVVTTEVLKRAENAIFQKAINAIRPIEIKKISESRKVLYQNPEPKVMVSLFFY